MFSALSSDPAEIITTTVFLVVSLIFTLHLRGMFTASLGMNAN